MTTKKFDWISNRGFDYGNAARERIGIIPNSEEAERIALNLYDEKKELEAQIKFLNNEMQDRIEDTRVILEQYPGVKFYRSVQPIVLPEYSEPVWCTNPDCQTRKDFPSARHYHNKSGGSIIAAQDATSYLLSTNDTEQT